jgi:tetratricopeptide (TPR) repeat protein
VSHLPKEPSALFSTLLVLFAMNCASSDGPKTVDRGSLRALVLPDLGRVEESVQAQLRERYATLTAKHKDPQTSDTDLGNEYGETGRLLMAAEFRDPAEAALLNAEALNPDDMRWPYYLGHVYREKGDIPNATVAFERALRSAPDDGPTMTWLGEGALDQGRTEVAEGLFAKALSLHPRSAAALYGLGRTALARKDYARAVQHLEQALALDSKASVIHYSLAMAYRGLGDHGQAESHMQQRGTLQIRPDPLKKELDGLLHSALTYERNADVAGARGEWAEAAEYLGKAVALAPARASPRHKLGTALFYMGDRRGAREHFEEAVRLSPAFSQAHYALGVIHEEAGEHRQAIESFSAAVKSAPVYIEARLGLANELRRSGLLGLSLSEYERILKIDPGAVRARFGYAAALIRLNRYREASDRLAEAMVLYPNDPSFGRAAARLLAAAPDNRVRDGRRALAIGQTLLTQQPRTIDLVETLAMASAEAGQFSEAVQWQREAIESAERTGRRDAIQRLADNLSRYQNGRPCRTPWQADEAIEY